VHTLADNTGYTFNSSGIFTSEGNELDVIPSETSTTTSSGRSGGSSSNIGDDSHGPLPPKELLLLPLPLPIEEPPLKSINSNQYTSYSSDNSSSIAANSNAYHIRRIRIGKRGWRGCKKKPVKVVVMQESRKKLRRWFCTARTSSNTTITTFPFRETYDAVLVWLYFI
jgi:hypothetical protein